MEIKKINLDRMYRANQYGRSMVEMLGVLAIIGVLSLVALIGYRYAMDKYRANETLHELSLRAVDVAKQASDNKITELTMNMGKKTKLGYTADAWVNEADTDYFFIGLEQVPTRVCRFMLDQGWQMPVRIFVGTEEFNGKNYICGKSEFAPKMFYEFAKNFEQSGTGIGDGSAEEETTIPDEELVTDGGTCPPEKPLRAWGGCYPCSVPYGVGVGVDGQCTEVCPDKILTPSGYCAPKCDASTPLIDLWGGCYGCNERTKVSVGVGGICSEICPDRVLQKEGSCVLPCGVGENAGKPLSDANGICHSCDTSTNVYVGQNGKCSEVCPDRFLSEGGDRCMLECGVGENKDKPLRDIYGDCFACDISGAVNVGEKGKCTVLCPDRKMGETFQTKGQCRLPCGIGANKDKIVEDDYGRCYACDSTSSFFVGVDGRCSEICPGQRLKNKSGTCLSCSSSTFNITNVEDVECNQCTDRVVGSNSGKTGCMKKCGPGYFWDQNYGCRGCNVTGSSMWSYWITPGEYSCTAACPNRTHVDGNDCVLCSANNFLGTGKRCYPCNQQGAISLSGVPNQGDSWCDRACPNREVVNGECVVKL